MIRLPGCAVLYVTAGIVLSFMCGEANAQDDSNGYNSQESNGQDYNSGDTYTEAPSTDTYTETPSTQEENDSNGNSWAQDNNVTDYNQCAGNAGCESYIQQNGGGYSSGQENQGGGNDDDSQ